MGWSASWRHIVCKMDASGLTWCPTHFTPRKGPLCPITGFCPCVNETFNLLRCYAVPIGSQLGKQFLTLQRTVVFDCMTPKDVGPTILLNVRNQTSSDSVTSQKTWNISNTTVRTSNLTPFLEVFADTMDTFHKALGLHEAKFYNQWCTGY
jgi:hypothetical protein